MAAHQTNDLVGFDGSYGSFEPLQLFAGEKEVVTNHHMVADSTEIKKYEVVAINDSDELVPYDPEGSDGEDVAVGIACQPTKEGGEMLPYYVSGYFNHEALVWPAAVATIEERKAVFKGTEIQIGTLHGSGN